MEAEQMVALKEAPVQLRPAPPRLGYVDGLRALAALEVVGYHTSRIVWPVSAPSSEMLSAVARLFSYGHAAVAVFIVLSGYSLMLPVVRHGGRLDSAYGSALGFYWRRARRILPPYYMAIAFSLALIALWIGRPTGSMWDNSLPVTWQSVLAHLLLVHNVIAQDSLTINPAFWTIAVECQIYVLFPLLVALWRRYHPVFMTALLVVAGWTLYAAVTIALLRLGGLARAISIIQIAPHFLGLFGLGICAAVMRGRTGALWRPLVARRIWEMLALVCFGVCAWFSPAPTLFSAPLVDTFTGLGALALLMIADRVGALTRRALEWRPLVWIGGFSYSLYLIHAPLIQVLWQYVFHPLGLGDTATYLLLLLVGGPLIVLAAWGFWYVCERPFLNSRNSRLAGARDARKGLPSAAV